MSNLEIPVEVIGGRIRVPSETKGLLFDMDGVLIDTLTLDLNIVNKVIAKYVESPALISKETIRENFALAIPEFFKELLKTVNVEITEKSLIQLIEEYEDIRRTSNFDVHAGIVEILQDAKQQEIKLAVVSNNSTEDIQKILNECNLLNYFDSITGNDLEGIRSKPYPDMYLQSAKSLNIKPSTCIVIEDSLIGAQAGHSAGCFVVGVSTGANSFDSLLNSEFVNNAYIDFSNIIEVK